MCLYFHACTTIHVKEKNTHLKENNDFHVTLYEVVKIFVEQKQLFPYWQDRSNEKLKRNM